MPTSFAAAPLPSFSERDAPFVRLPEAFERYRDVAPIIPQCATLTLFKSRRRYNQRAMVCPNCKLVNPPSAPRCDCGYDFQMHAMREPCLTERDGRLLRQSLGVAGRIAKLSRREIRLCLFALLPLCLLPWFYLFGLSGMAGDSGNALGARDYLFLAWIWTFPLTLAVALIFRRRIPDLILLPLLHAVSFIAWLAPIP